MSQTERVSVYAEPQQVGKVLVWRADDGWWCKGPNELQWRPMSHAMVQLACEYAVVKWPRAY